MSSAVVEKNTIKTHTHTHTERTRENADKHTHTRIGPFYGLSQAVRALLTVSQGNWQNRFHMVPL